METEEVTAMSRIVRTEVAPMSTQPDSTRCTSCDSPAGVQPTPCPHVFVWAYRTSRAPRVFTWVCRTCRAPHIFTWACRTCTHWSIRLGDARDTGVCC
jgi:hypothetical protein